MIEVAICDDDRIICEDLARRVQDQEPDCKVTCFTSGEELLANATGLDIVFLDIGMREENGLEVAEKLKEHPGLLVIFVTAHSEHVFEAFDVGAFHYLLKPLEEEKFRQVLDRAVAEVRRRQGQEPLKVKSGNAYRFIPVQQIYYAESSGRKILLHTEAETVEFYGRMQELEERLGEGFFRCHRGYLVHMKYITGYDSTTIFLKNGAKVYLAKQKYGEFSAAYLAYLRQVIQ